MYRPLKRGLQQLVSLSLIAGILSVTPLGPAHAAEITDGLALWYKLDAQSGTVAADSSGNNRNGTLVGAAGWTGGQGLAFNGSNTYVKMPDNVIAEMTEVTVSADVFIDPTLSGNYFFYNFGNVAVGSPASGTGYLFSTGNATYRGSISASWWNTEQNAVRSPAAALARGVWKHITYTVGGGTARLYEDGVQVGVNTAVTNSPAAIGGGVTTANFVGKSAYAADNLFKGKIKDFRLYQRVLAGSEVSQLSAQNAALNIAADKAALTLGDTTAVTGNFALPATAPGGSAVTWASSNSAVVSAAGVVTRPASGQPSATATLTATLTHRGLTESKTFDITVLPQSGDPEIAAAAAAALTVRNIGDVRGNLTLPATGENGTVVTWMSHNPPVVDATGEVHRPAPGSGGTTVTLTATVAKNQAIARRDFTAVVPELPAPQALKGYMFSYFTGEGTSNGEQVYFGLSRGNDALQWRELNNGNPVLTSTLGERGLRDPFIIRSPEGDKFYQIATDLRIFGGNGWDAAQRTGSKSIMVWESTDLVNWTNQRLVKVSPDTAGNTWAPEAYYDEGLGAYVVFWASKIYADDDPNHTGNTYNKMLYAITRDFYTFSAPQVWVDPGYSVIDSTIIKDGGTYYRFTKDERNNTSTTPCSKFIIEQKSSSILNLGYDFVAECIGKGSISQGEGPLIFKSNTEQKWYLFIVEFGGRGYIPFETTDLASGVWRMSTGYSLPSRPRHGTVLPVTAAEYDRLLRAYQPDQLAESADDVNTVTGIGDAPVLPSTVMAHYVGGASRAAAVTWDPIPASAYAAPGTFTVEGTLIDSATMRARANVTVSAEGVPVESLTVTPASLRLGVGVSRKLNATVLPANATARRLTWASSDPAVAAVSADGTVTTVGAGTATITVNTADNSRTVAIPVEARTDIPADLVVRYTFEETGGTVVQDATGRGNDGAYVRTPAWGTGVDGSRSFKMSGGSSSSTTAPYVQIPNGVLNGADSVTVSTWVKWNSSTTVNQWIYGLGQDRNKYLFTGPYNGAGRLFSAITTGSWPAESQMVAGSGLVGNTWKHITVVVDSNAKTAVMYLDGIEIARATNVAVKPSDLYDAARTYSGYIGKSLYAEDPYFNGEVDDFRVYNRALQAAEVLEIAGKTTAIAAVSLPELKIAAIVDDANSRIKLPVREGSDLAHLAPQFTTARGATVSPASGTVRDLTRPVTYTVTGSDGASRDWTVEALVMRSPVIPGLYADPNITVFGDTFYIYPTTDGFSGWTGTQFHAFSSKDLVHWTDHGVILDLGPDVAWADNSAWAPTIAEKNGKYYFYFSGGLATGDTAKHLGVAVADSPTGPFRDALGRPLVPAGTYSGQMIDAAVFTDDDGQSYLYWGNGNSYQVRLNDDMISFDAAGVKTYKPTNYNEGTFVFKRNGLYYFTWSENDTRSEDYQVAYATGASPTGPWSARQGVILSKDLALGIKGTGHHSVVRVPGTDDWYIAYHRFAMPGGNGFNRETTVDRLEFNGDNTIRKVVPTLESVDPITIVRAGADVSGGEGSAISLAGTSSAASVATAWTYRPVSGVDAGATCAFADAGAPATTITCTDDGTYEVTLSGGRSTDSAIVTVDNSPPVITGVTGPAVPMAAKTSVSVTAQFVDNGGNDTQACSVDWADGTTSAGVLSAGTCSASHAYPAAGIYSPKVTITDDDGGSFTATFHFVVVYDPSAGFVTGSGWIASPAGAYPADPGVTGKVSFGFVSKYKPGANAPDGDTEFAFGAANLTFQSTRHDWLVVFGTQATFQGSGTVNGTGDYGFEVTAIDGNLVGGDGVDRFRIRIWDRATDDTVYDTGSTGITLGGGGIVIHAKK